MPKDPEELPELEDLDPLEEPEEERGEKDEEMTEHEPFEALEPLVPPEAAESEPEPERVPEAKDEPVPAPVAAAAALGPVAAGEPAVAADPAPAGGEPERPTKKPGEKRELEQAPILLRKASLILLIGALFPFFAALQDDFGAWGAWAIAKVLALAAGWIFHQGYVATHGGKEQQFVGHRSDPRRRPDATKNFVERLADAHPLAPAILSGAIAVGAFVPAFLAGAIGAIGGEVATLLLASATFSHIFGYEHGGKFNPIFPLMFLGPGIAGVLNVFGAVARFGDSAGLALLGLLGSVIVGFGGLMAIYTMYVAMKQAKVEGDRKRQEMREYRKAQRQTTGQTLRRRRSAGGGGGE